MKTSIYIACHKPARVVSNDAVKPIRVGFNKDSIAEITLRDDSGQSIAHKNASYCELTAHYWAWRNDTESDFVGMMHYRRYFDFLENSGGAADQWGVINRPSFGYCFADEFGLHADVIAERLRDYDFVLPHKWNVRSAGFKTVEEHYSKAPGHHSKDLLVVRSIIAERHPEYLPFYEAYMNSNEGYFTNMFVMRRAYFEDYSEWLFDVLEEAERRIDISGYDPVAKRVFGYLSERLFNVWLAKLTSARQNLRFLHLARVFVHDTDPVPVQGNGVVLESPDTTLAIASDNGYAPHLGALLCSIVENLRDGARVEFVILDGGISGENKFALQRAVGIEGRHSIRFIDMRNEFKDQVVHMHFHQSTFFRLVLSELLPNRSRVLYIDCDTIVLDDVVSLFNTNLAGNPVGAVFDYIMHHFCKTAVPSMSETGGLPSQEYLQSYVGMEKSWKAYFQAGLILFDLEMIRSLRLEYKMIAELKRKRYWFLDQDVLNKFINGRVTFLDPAWNVVNVGDQVTVGLTPIQIDELMAAKACPKLIHYAGYEAKPWISESAPLAGFYWQYLRMTPWYEQVRKSLEQRRYGKSHHAHTQTDNLREATVLEQCLANYHRMSKDPVIGAYRKIRKTFNAWPYNVKTGDEFTKVANYHRMTKDPFITGYRRFMRTIGLWKY